VVKNHKKGDNMNIMKYFCQGDKCLSDSHYCLMNDTQHIVQPLDAYNITSIRRQRRRFHKQDMIEKAEKVGLQISTDGSIKIQK